MTSIDFKNILKYEKEVKLMNNEGFIIDAYDDEGFIYLHENYYQMTHMSMKLSPSGKIIEKIFYDVGEVNLPPPPDPRIIPFEHNTSLQVPINKTIDITQYYHYNKQPLPIGKLKNIDHYNYYTLNENEKPIIISHIKKNLPNYLIPEDFIGIISDKINYITPVINNHVLSTRQFYCPVMRENGLEPDLKGNIQPYSLIGLSFLEIGELIEKPFSYKMFYRYPYGIDCEKYYEPFQIIKIKDKILISDNGWHSNTIDRIHILCENNG